MRRCLFLCCLVVAPVGSTAAQDDEPKPKVLLLHPKGPSSPVLTWHLLPEAVEQTPGNAAPFYKRAIELLEKGDERSKVMGQISQWREMPLAEFPRAEVRRFLDKRKELFEQIEAGTRCEYWDFGLLERLRESDTKGRMPELQEVRMMAFYLVLRARCELAEDNPEQALRTRKSGLALSRQVGQLPTLSGFLLETAISSMMLVPLDEVVQHPKAPNLYWPLTDLPRPFANLRRGLEGDRLSLYATFPGMLKSATDLNAGPISEEQAQQSLKQVFKDLGIKPDRVEELKFGLRILNKHEEAKLVLIQLGRPKEKVEAMPHVQVALLHAFAQYDQILDGMAKWRTFPDWGMKNEDAIRQRKGARVGPWREKQRPAIPLAASLMTVLEGSYKAQARLDRNIAALRCVEAIRLYAAAHDGKLPATLGAIKEVPIPIDPMTGKAFEYEVKGDKATLASPLPKKDPPGYTVAYAIMLKR